MPPAFLEKRSMMCVNTTSPPEGRDLKGLYRDYLRQEMGRKKSGICFLLFDNIPNFSFLWGGVLICCSKNGRTLCCALSLRTMTIPPDCSAVHILMMGAIPMVVPWK